jgi:hypothetical protein
VTDPFIAIQVGAVSFLDEGIPEVINTIQERAGVNAVFLATPTWTRRTGGRQVPGFALPDHGVQEYDLDWVGGNYATVHPEYYTRTAIGPVGRAPEHPDFDMLAEVIPEAKRRGMKSYASIEESSYADELRTYPNFLSTMEVDIWNKPARRPCFNNPDYRNWHLGIVEDYIDNYDLDGIAWCSQRPGPLTMLMQGPTKQGLGLVTCFCQYCRAIAADRNIDWRRAQEGYRKLVTWNGELANDRKHSDGAFVSFWRLLLQYPELLSWQTIWTDSQHQMYRDIYGTVKAARPEVEVGWHLYQNISFSPFYRADQSYSDISHFSDFLKVDTYDNVAGPRFHTWVENICSALFADATPDEVYPLMLKILKLEEGAFDELPSSGFSAGYVKRETERAVAGVEGRAKIWAGIDIDIPAGEIGGSGETRVAGVGVSVITTKLDAERASTACTPESVRDATLAAFEGGADGVVLSRKYSEMRLDNLSGVGMALKAIG